MRLGKGTHSALSAKLDRLDGARDHRDWWVHDVPRVLNVRNWPLWAKAVLTVPLVYGILHWVWTLPDWALNQQSDHSVRLVWSEPDWMPTEGAKDADRAPQSMASLATWKPKGTNKLTEGRPAVPAPANATLAARYEFPAATHQSLTYSRPCRFVHFEIPNTKGLAGPAAALRTRLTSHPACEARHTRSEELTFQDLQAPGGGAGDGDGDGDGFTSFAFGRDPLERFLSLYNWIRPVGDYRAPPKPQKGRKGRKKHRAPAEPLMCTWGCEGIWAGLPSRYLPEQDRPAARFPYRMKLDVEQGARVPPEGAEAVRELKAFLAALEGAVWRRSLPVSEGSLERRDPQRCAGDYATGTLIHWRWLPQVAFLTGADGQLAPISHIGRLENLTAEWEAISHRLRSRTWTINPIGTVLDAAAGDERKKVRYRRSEFEDPARWQCGQRLEGAGDQGYCAPVMGRESLDAEIIQVVCRIYAADYEVFGYPLPDGCSRDAMAVPAPRHRNRSGKGRVQAADDVSYKQHWWTWESRQSRIGQVMCAQRVANATASEGA